jgi:hypothetical protein
MLPVAAVIASGDDAVTAGVPVLLPHVTVAVPAVAGTVCVIVPEVVPVRRNGAPVIVMPPVPA